MSTPQRRSPRPPPRPLRLPQPVAAVVAKIMVAAVAMVAAAVAVVAVVKVAEMMPATPAAALSIVPLATKARRRANDFDNADHEGDDIASSSMSDPDGDSVYRTHSISFTTGPDGLEIQTNNISYSARADADAGTVAEAGAADA